MWRGHVVRRQTSGAVQRARERVRLANASAQKAHSIKSRLPSILERLKNCKYLTSLANQLHTLGMCIIYIVQLYRNVHVHLLVLHVHDLYIIMNVPSSHLLEMITIASEVCSRTLVEADCLPVLLDLIVQTNRSQAALVVVAGIIRILANIAKVRTVCCIVKLVHVCYEVYYFICQWESTCSSIHQCPNSMACLVDLVYKVHNSQTALLLATLQLMVTCTAGTKVCCYLHTHARVVSVCMICFLNMCDTALEAYMYIVSPYLLNESTSLTLPFHHLHQTDGCTVNVYSLSSSVYDPTTGTGQQYHTQEAVNCQRYR